MSEDEGNSNVMVEGPGVNMMTVTGGESMVLDSGQVSLYLPSLTSGHNSKLIYYHLLKKVSVLSFYGAPIMHSNKLRS